MTAPRKNGKTGSRNPANRPTREPRGLTAPTPVGEWKKAAVGRVIELPSGKGMRIKGITIQSMMASGIMPNALIKVVKKALDKGAGRPGMDEQMAIEMIADPGKVQEMLVFIDKLTCQVALEPRVLPIPKDESDRDPDELYVDEIDEEDKMFIFQVATSGDEDTESFRLEHSTTMDAIRRQQDLELPTK
jgi:hypothetical protein